MCRMTDWPTQTVVAYAFNPGSQETETGRFLWVRDQSDVQSELQDIQDHTVRSCVKKNN